MVWPHLLPKSRADLISAALRHVQDAESLVNTSPVEAYYLAGYGPECARKAALSPTDNDQHAQELDKAVGHGFKKDPEAALALVCSLDSLATRYTLRDWKARHPILAQWNEQCRYARSDAVSIQEAKRLTDAASALTTEVVALLWADGRLPSLEGLVRVKP